MDEDFEGLAVALKWLAVLADPAGVQHRVKDLTAAIKAYQDKIDENNKSVFALATKQKQIDAASAAAEALEADVKRWSDQLQKQEADLKSKLGDLADREKSVSAAESNVKVREAKVGERETTMDHREAALAEREAAVVEKLAAAKALMQSYDKAKHEAALKLAG